MSKIYRNASYNVIRHAASVAGLDMDYAIRVARGDYTKGGTQWIVVFPPSYLFDDEEIDDIYYQMAKCLNEDFNLATSDGGHWVTSNRVLMLSFWTYIGYRSSGDLDDQWHAGYMD